MNSDLSALLPAMFCLLTAAFFAAVAVMGYLRSQRRNAAWQELAARNGLQFEPGSVLSYPSVSGRYRGRNLVLKNIRRTRGKQRAKTYTRLTLSVANRANLRFGLYDQDAISGLFTALGAQDVRIGDEAVDRRFVIKSQPEEFARRLFAAPGLRERLLQVKPMNLTLEGNELVFEQYGILNDADRLKFLFDLLTDVADKAEGG